MENGKWKIIKFASLIYVYMYNLAKHTKENLKPLIPLFPYYLIPLTNKRNTS